MTPARLLSLLALLVASSACTSTPSSPPAKGASDARVDTTQDGPLARHARRLDEDDRRGAGRW